MVKLINPQPVKKFRPFVDPEGSAQNPAAFLYAELDKFSLRYSIQFLWNLF
jgi:hypothetical protein